MRYFLNRNTPINYKSGDLKHFISLILGTYQPVPYKEISLLNDNGEEHKFQDHYQKNIKPHINEFENRRIKRLGELKERSQLSTTVFFFVLVCSGILLYKYQPSSPQENIYDVVAVVNFLIFSGLSAWCYAPIKKYKTSVKGLIFPKIFSFFGSDFFYSEKSFLLLSDFTKSHLIPNYDKHHFEDYIKGRYNDVTLELVEATFKKDKGSGKNRRTVTVFHGLLIKFSMNKKFSGQTVLKKDRGSILNFLSGSPSNMKKVELEDPVFEKLFNVHSTDQVEARYLLTVSFMERLIKLANLYSKEIECSFYDKMLIFKIPVNKNLFEVSSIFEPATFEDDIKRIVKEMDQIFAIIDILKLNMKIGL